MAHKFSRSHINALHECPRLAWYRYYDKGKGWESRKLNVQQSTGSLAHSMLATILQWVRACDKLPESDQIDKAASDAIAQYKHEALQRGLDIEQIGSMEYELNRQAALAEGLVRAWVRVRLPSIHERFKAIAVEEEWEVALDAGEIVCMVRIDCVLEDRQTGELWPLEFKTTGWMDDAWLEKWRYDSQTLMHAWATERHYPDKQVGGVIVEALYKGTKRRNEAGDDVYYSPLIRAYLKRGVPPFDEDEWSTDSAVARRKGWEAVDVWQTPGVGAWVARLDDEILRAQLFSVEVFRNEKEMETWVRQTLQEQRMIANDLVELKVGDEAVQETIMDRDFPARLSASCYSNQYRRKCVMIGACYHGIEPGDSDEFMERVPHHANEVEE